MGMFDEPEARGTGGLDPQKAGKVGSEVIKQVGVGARALFQRASPYTNRVPGGHPRGGGGVWQRAR